MRIRLSSADLLPRCVLHGAVSLMLAVHAFAQTGAPAPSAPALPAPAVPVAPSEKPIDLNPILELSAIPALRLRAQSTWDEGYASIRAGLGKLRDEASKAGLVVEGAPKVHFVDSDDIGFTYEALLPLASAPTATFSFPAGVDLAATPPGRAIRFTHEGAYDELDAAYEAITAFLDEKGLKATGKFIEEYLAIPEKADDSSLRLNIYVFLQ